MELGGLKRELNEAEMKTIYFSNYLHEQSGLYIYHRKSRLSAGEAPYRRV